MEDGHSPEETRAPAGTYRYLDDRITTLVDPVINSDGVKPSFERPGITVQVYRNGVSGKIHLMVVVPGEDEYKGSYVTNYADIAEGDIVTNLGANLNASAEEPGKPVTASLDKILEQAHFVLDDPSKSSIIFG